MVVEVRALPEPLLAPPSTRTWLSRCGSCRRRCTLLLGAAAAVMELRAPLVLLAPPLLLLVTPPMLVLLTRLPLLLAPLLEVTAAVMEVRALPLLVPFSCDARSAPLLEVAAVDGASDIDVGADGPGVVSLADGLLDDRDERVATVLALAALFSPAFDMVTHR